MTQPEDTNAMSPHRKLFTSLCIASTLALTAAPVLADDENDADNGNPSELAQEGAQKLMLALELMLQAIPQYAMPEILDNGDIIIRRLNPTEEGDADDDRPSATKEGDEVEETDI